MAGMLKKTRTKYVFIVAFVKGKLQKVFLGDNHLAGISSRGLFAPLVQGESEHVSDYILNFNRNVKLEI